MRTETDLPTKDGALTAWLRVHDVAAMLGVSANTVRRWTDDGKIPAYRSPGGHRRYRADEVLALVPPHDQAAPGVLPPGDGRRSARRRGPVVAQGADPGYLQGVVDAGQEITALLDENPQDVPLATARRLCDLTSAARCEIFAFDNGTAEVMASWSGGRPDDERRGERLPLDEWLSGPDSGAGEDTTILTAGASTLTDAARLGLERRACRTLLWTPLTSRGRLVGAIELSHDSEAEWSGFVALVEGLGRIVGHALDVVSVYRQLDRRERTMREILDLAQEVSRTHDLKQFVRAFADRIMVAVDAADIDVWRIEPDGIVRLIMSIDRNGVDDAVTEKPLDVAHYPSVQRVMADRQPLIVTSADDPTLTPAEVEVYREWGYVNSLTIPLVSGGTLVGLIDLYDDRPRDWREQVPFLTSVSQLVAGLFDNALLINELQAQGTQQRELVELGDAISAAGDLAQLARVVAARMRETLEAEDCDIWRIEGDVMHCLASIDSRGWDAAEFGREESLNEYEASAAFLARNEPRVIGDVAEGDLDEREIRDYGRWGYQSLVSLPLVADGRPLGFIDVFDTRVRDWNDRLDFIKGVGRMLTGAFEKAILVDQLEEGNRDLRLLVDSSRDFSATLDYDAVLERVAARILEVSGADMCDVYSREGDAAEIRATAGGEWAENPVGLRYSLADFPTFVQVMESKQPLAMPDVLEADLSPSEREDASTWGYRATLDLPLIVQDEVIGFVELEAYEPREFEQQGLILGLAQVAAQAIANARLYRELDERAHRMSLMTDAALELSSSLDLRETLLSTARRLCATVDVPNCDINVLDSRGALHCMMSLIDGEVDEGWVGRELPLDRRPITRQVMTTGKPTVVTSLDDDRLDDRTRELNREHSEKSWATLPLTVKDRVIGVAHLIETRAERAFDETVLEAAAAICHVAALAIDNAGLHREKDLQNVRLGSLLAAGRTIASSMDLETVLSNVARTAAEAVGSPECLIFEYLKEEDAEIVRARYAKGEVTFDFIRELDHLSDYPTDRAIIKGDQVVVETISDPDLPDDVRASMELWRETTCLSAPLRFQDEPFGMLVLIESERERQFTEGEIELIAGLSEQAAVAIHNARLYDEIKRMHLGNLKALSSALNAKDYYTLGHAARVATYMVLVGRKLGWSVDFQRQIEEAAYLHDIGKISISDRVLLKAGRLNSHEWQQMRQHPVFSADIIKPLFSEELVLGVRYHHEHYDGGGYPDGLAGEDIPMLARVMAVVDAYDAMSCRRPYKQALTYDECLAELLRCRGSQFDPGVVDVFLDVLGEILVSRRRSEAVAAEAAARIPGDKHLVLRGPEDESRPEYLEIAQILREVRDANPPIRFLCTHLRFQNRFVIGVDPEEDEAQKSHFGEEFLADEEVASILTDGTLPHVNTLFADAYGVWVTGLAPLRTTDGDIVAVVAADLPALAASEAEAPREGTRETFASMLHTAATRLSRAEIDAITDALTGLYNHRYLHERLAEEVERAGEQQLPLSLLFCDLDHFKEFNDHNGHSAGDRVLREVAHLIEQSVRNVDVAARYGGEEFVLVLVDTEQDKALAVAERIRKRVEDAAFTTVDGLLTLSIGVATFPENGQTKEELLDQADVAMYRAKRGGRNRAIAAAPTQPA